MDPLLQTVQQRQLQVRTQNPHRNPRKSSPCSHINESSTSRDFHILKRQTAVQKMLSPHLRILCNGGQVHSAVCFHKHLLVCGKFPELFFCQGQSAVCEQFFCTLPFHDRCSPFCNAVSQTRSTEISAGETPEIRLACPIFAGRWAFSFSAASRRSPRICV